MKPEELIKAPSETTGEKPLVLQVGFPVLYVPTAFLIGRDGRILKTFVGARDKSDFDQAIRLALPQDSWMETTIQRMEATLHRLACC